MLDWGEDADPIADLKAARKRLSVPENKFFYKEMGRIEKAVQDAAEQLLKGGMTAEGVAQELVKAGIWPEWPCED